EGEFKDGVFRRRADVEGKRNLDGYQAIWEHVNGRPMVYPKPRYPQPIFMDPANYEWVPVEAAPGVAEKLLGVFTERRSEAGCSSSTPARATPRAAKASTWSRAAQAPSAMSRCALSPRFISSRAKRRWSWRARRRSSCISDCRISQACARRCALRR